MLEYITRLVPVPQLLPPLVAAANDETHLEGRNVYRAPRAAAVPVVDELRENFIGSENVSVGATDCGYLDAGVFGTLILAE